MRQRALSYLLGLDLDALKAVVPKQLALGLRTLWYCYQVSIGLHVKERARTAKMILGLLETLGGKNKKITGLEGQLAQKTGEVNGLCKSKRSVCAEIVLYQDTVDDLDKQLEAEKERARTASKRDQATIRELRKQVEELKLLALKHRGGAVEYQEKLFEAEAEN